MAGVCLMFNFVTFTYKKHKFSFYITIITSTQEVLIPGPFFSVSRVMQI